MQHAWSSAERRNTGTAIISLVECWEELGGDSGSPQLCGSSDHLKYITSKLTGKVVSK